MFDNFKMLRLWRKVNRCSYIWTSPCASTIFVMPPPLDLCFLQCIVNFTSQYCEGTVLIHINSLVCYNLLDYSLHYTSQHGNLLNHVLRPFILIRVDKVFQCSATPGCSFSLFWTVNIRKMLPSYLDEFLKSITYSTLWTQFIPYIDVEVQQKVMQSPHADVSWG
jgi:hypothetical protein